jgi:L-lactate dehydrogenase complex protein LldG
MSDVMKIDKISLFLENAARAAAGPNQLKDKEKLAETVSKLVPKGASVFCPQSTKLEKAATAKLSRMVADYGSANVTIEEVSAAIAETGSIVCDSKDGKAVQASLLPSHHIAILPREKIFATLDDFFDKYSASAPTNITLITGPSRTADIGLELAIGVHGPERLDIIVV